MFPNADIQISAISALKMFADSRYADIKKKCRYADIADADINIGTPLQLSYGKMLGCVKVIHFDSKLSCLSRLHTLSYVVGLHIGFWLQNRKAGILNAHIIVKLLKFVHVAFSLLRMLMFGLNSDSE